MTISLRTGRATVLRDLASTGIGGIRLDASRRHVLVVGATPWLEGDAERGVGHERRGEVGWIGGPVRPWDVAG